MNLLVGLWLLLSLLSLMLLIFLFFSLKYTSSPNLSNCLINMLLLPKSVTRHMLTLFTEILRFSLNLKNFPSSDLKFSKCYVFSFNCKNVLISSFFLDSYRFATGCILIRVLRLFTLNNLNFDYFPYDLAFLIKVLIYYDNYYGPSITSV